jgi:hypothetical protein
VSVLLEAWGGGRPSEGVARVASWRRCGEPDIMVEPWRDLRPGVGGLLGQMQPVEARRGKSSGCRGQCGEVSHRAAMTGMGRGATPDVERRPGPRCGR